MFTLMPITTHAHTASINRSICVRTIPIRVDSNQLTLIPKPRESRVKVSWLIYEHLKNSKRIKTSGPFSLCKLCWIRLFEYMQIKKKNVCEQGSELGSIRINPALVLCVNLVYDVIDFLRLGYYDHSRH